MVIDINTLNTFIMLSACLSAFIIYVCIMYSIYIKKN